MEGDPKQGETWVPPNGRETFTVLGVSSDKVWMEPLGGGADQFVALAEVQNDWRYVNPEAGANRQNVRCEGNYVHFDRLAGPLPVSEAIMFAAWVLYCADPDMQQLMLATQAIRAANA